MQYANHPTMPADMAGFRLAYNADPLTSVIVADTCDVAETMGFAVFRDTGLPWLDGVTIEAETAATVEACHGVIAHGGDFVDDAWRVLRDTLRLAWFCHVAEIDARAWYLTKVTDLVGTAHE